MRVQDVTLPGLDAGDQWCELLIHTATPEVGKQWTDTGEIHEERDLKGRDEGETRSAPGHPALTRILRQHIEDEQLKPGDLLFQGETGGILAGSVIRRAWRNARKAVLPPARLRVAHRAACVRQPAHTPDEVAQRRDPARSGGGMGGEQRPRAAGHLGPVRDGQLPDLKKRLEAAGDLPELPGAD
jgi:hypothetical protein